MNQKCFYLIFALLTLFSQIACSQKSNNQTSTTSQTKVSGISELLTPADFAEKIKSQPGIIIDVRTPQETKKGIIPNARLLNIFDDNFETEINKLDKNTTCYVYCASGGRSAEAAEMMIKRGFKHVVDLDGGYTKWVEQSMPTVLP